MALLEYLGHQSQIKLPTNSAGDLPPDSLSPRITCFLIWSSLPGSGSIILSIDEDTYPYAYNWALSAPRRLDGTPLFIISNLTPTAGSPTFYRPDLPNASAGE